MNLVFENSDGSLSIGTPSERVDLDVFKQQILDVRVKIREKEITLNRAPSTSLLVWQANIDDSDLPNAAKDGAPEIEVQDYFIVDGLPIKKPVNDNIRHLRASWRWDGVKIIEDAALAKAMRASNVRAVRNQLLTDSDSDEFALTGQALADAKAYRAALRDLGVAIDADPENVSFPTLVMV